MDQHDSPGIGRYHLEETVRIDLPAMVVDQGRGFDAHIVKSGEKVKERVTRLRHENFASRVAEQAEQEAVGLAGACGQNDLAWLDSNAVHGIVGADGFSRRKNSPGLRIVVESLRIGERIKQGWIVVKPAAGRIRGSQIGNRQTCSEAHAVGPRQLAFFRVPGCPLRKAHVPRPVSLSRLSHAALVTAGPSCTIKDRRPFPPYTDVHEEAHWVSARLSLTMAWC